MCPASEQLSTRRRSLVITSLLMLALAALGGRLVQLHVFAHEQFDLRAIRQHGQFERLPARPGDLLDVRGRLLATSVEVGSIFVDPKSIPSERRRDVAQSLAVALDVDLDELERRLEQNATRRFLWVKRRVSEDELRAVRDLKWPHHWVSVQTELRRGYPMGSLASHVLGLRDVDGVARDGIERSFDAVLSGTSGYRIVARDAHGKTLTVEERFLRRPQPGSSVVLTIDSVIQTFAEQAIETVVADWQPASATAIVMNPKTGEVLALANRPTFDPDDPATAAPDAWVNRAISDCYEPGSTFKPFIMATALDWEVVRLDDVIDCRNGVYRMGPRVLHSHHRNGDLTMPQIMIRSDNIGMAIIGERMTNSGLFRAVQMFGFGRETGVDLPGESCGHVRPLRAWTPYYSTGSIPMGHELAVTPMQLITAFAALANGGEMIRPRLVRAVVGPDGRALRVFDRPEVMGRAVRPETAAVIIDPILRGVIDDPQGTGRRIRDMLGGYTGFGKSGTAQKLAETGGYASGRHVSSFVAGAPATDPQLVVLVVVNDPSIGKEHYGGQVAAPATAQILERSLIYLQVPFDREPPVTRTARSR